MLVILIAVFPAIFTILAYRYFYHKESRLKDHWKELAILIVLYSIVANLLIVTGLHWIGLQSFNLFEMGVSFKLKWLGLQFGFGVIFMVIYHNIKCIYIEKLSLWRHFKKVLPAILFLDVTYAVFTPSSLFLSNIEEFSIAYFKIIPVLLVVMLILTLAAWLVALCFTNEKNAFFSSAIIFSVGFALYIQGNFLNPDFPALDGTELIWSNYATEEKISTVFWCVSIAAAFLAAWRWKDKTAKVVTYASGFLCLVQMLSLIVLVFTNPLGKTVDYGMSKEGQFSLGSKENIVIFVVDTLQADTLNQYVNSEAYIEGGLDDFTFFDEAVGGGAPTRIAIPLLLTGYEYEPRQSIDEYSEEAWQETPLYDDLHAKGWDVRLYTSMRATAGCSEKNIDNYEMTGAHWVGNYPKFGIQLYKLVNFYLFPQSFKEYFWLATDAISDEIASSNVGYSLDDLRFHQDLEAVDALETGYEKAFRLYHFRGVHKPCYITANLERVKDADLSEQETLQGIMKIIFSYMEKMKEAGVYDNSMIIILGDHGRHEDGNLENNPAVLIKRPGESHELEHNMAPIHFRNVFATMAANIMTDYSKYGPCVYDLDENTDVERCHTIDKSILNRNVFQEPNDDSLLYTRLMISGKAGEIEYHIFDPFSVNRILYHMGDKIDFEAGNAYAKELNYRLYQEDSVAIASNELSICFDLSESGGKKSKKDFVFHFIYSDVYNDSQLMRVYANGKKIEYVTCTQEESGTEKTVTIPAKNLKNDKLVIRMVFPGAALVEQTDSENSGSRILSMAFQSMWLTQ